MYLFLGNNFVCTGAVFAAILMFEYPFIGLEKIIFGRTSSFDKKPLTTSKKNNSANKDKHSQKSPKSESENKFEEQNQKHNSRLTNGATNFRQNCSVLTTQFDNITY